MLALHGGYFTKYKTAMAMTMKAVNFMITILRRRRLWRRRKARTIIATPTTSKSSVVMCSNASARLSGL